MQSYKNGYSKISGEDPNADGYFQNVERVLAKQKNLRGEVDITEDEIIESETEEGTGSGVEGRDEKE